ncbi:MAG: 6-phosphogluconolactonase [Clostridiales bacterium]|jgi:glucosamine-6-phosphate deaminase|nr:6-phosphogluconolactonase [Clostridiales bacterium]
MLRETKIDNLRVHVYASRTAMGNAAAKDAAGAIQEAIEKNGAANVVFAAAPSQREVLAGLLASDLDWKRVRAFQQDEYIGLDSGHPAGFGNFLRRHIFGKAPFREVFLMECAARETASESCVRYCALLEKYPPDVILLGFGENGHLAFNDPPVADFNDPLGVKPVLLDPVCRRQQVNDGCFAALEEVPEYAITLTIPRIMSAPRAVVTVPGPSKADAVRAALLGPVSSLCPASILRTHPDAALYLDSDSAAKTFVL